MIQGICLVVAALATVLSVLTLTRLPAPEPAFIASMALAGVGYTALVAARLASRVRT
jgi:hypothetical protein